MKVWVVTFQSTYEDYCIQEVCSSEEAALAWIKANANGHGKYYDVMEWEVNEG